MATFYYYFHYDDYYCCYYRNEAMMCGNNAKRSVQNCKVKNDLNELKESE